MSGELLGLKDLLAWLEYGRHSGYLATRQSKEQEEHWATLLRKTLEGPSPHLEAGGLTKEELDRFMKERGYNCPVCGRDEIRHDHEVEPLNWAYDDGTVVETSMFCSYCEATWDEVYHLKGIRNLVRPGTDGVNESP